MFLHDEHKYCHACLLAIGVQSDDFDSGRCGWISKGYPKEVITAANGLSRS